MELPRRDPADVYLPNGAFTAMTQRLKDRHGDHDLRIAIVYPFDFRTRMLPYWYADTRVVPCSVRTLADCLQEAGFEHVRIVLQQWTPNFKPSQAVLDGRPLDVLMVSAMQVHADCADEIIRDAHTCSTHRPLILAGGPKAIYEPTDLFDLGAQPGVGADCVVTGEVYVLLELLETILDQRHGDEPVLRSFSRARAAGALGHIPGLVYLDPASKSRQPVAINTGMQRLLRDLDELPMPDAGYRRVEPPHRRPTLSPSPYPANRIGRKSTIATMLATQGCKFNCSYCPIPAVNQRTWRHKSAARFAAEIKHIHESFGIREFFGTDDNFFNDRETVIACMTALANTTTQGAPLGERISFYTEATEFDVHKHRDLLGLCHRAGLRAIWFGIEDITAKLVNKGQTADKTAELFRELYENGIQPMALTIHSDDQPLSSPLDSLAGLLNQARYLFMMGAVSYQCTYLGPAVGTRDFEPAARTGAMFKSVGGKPIPQAFQDGNHVVASRHAKPWWRQLNVLLAYSSFYNPLNTARVLLSRDPPQIKGKRLLFQAIGQIGLFMTIPKLVHWAFKMKRGPIEKWDGLQPARIPMIDAATGLEMNWAIEQIPSLAPDSQPSVLGTPRPVKRAIAPPSVDLTPETSYPASAMKPVPLAVPRPNKP